MLADLVQVWPESASIRLQTSASDLEDNAIRSYLDHPNGRLS